MAEQKVVGLTANAPAPNDWVEMAHDGIDKNMRCSPKAVAHWEARGWSVVDDDAAAPVTAEQVAAVEAEKPTAQRASTGTES